LVYFVAIWYILWPFAIFYGHLVYFVIIWYMFSHFGMLYQENLATLHVLQNDIAYVIFIVISLSLSHSKSLL
jgi:hypothetical protein